MLPQQLQSLILDHSDPIQFVPFGDQYRIVEPRIIALQKFQPAPR